MDNEQHGRLPAPLAALVAGAAGTAALNITSYADMLVRARPPSAMPANIVLALAKAWHVTSLLDEGDDAQRSAAAHRREAAGALLGYVNGLTFPLFACLLSRHAMPLRGGAAVGVAVMAASDVPAIALGATDPKTWGFSGWLSDLVPHLVYGWVTEATCRAIQRAD